MEAKTPTNSMETRDTEQTPPQHLPLRTRHLSLIMVMTILTILLVCIAIFFDKITNISWLQDIAYTALGRKNPNILPLPTSTPIPTPTPSYLPAGKQTYSISGSSIGPKVSSLTLDPLDAHMGDKQSLSVIASSDKQFIGISITLFSDTKKTILPLNFDGNAWKTTWTLNDSVNDRYIIRIEATDKATSSSTLIAPRTRGPIHLDELR